MTIDIIAKAHEQRQKHEANLADIEAAIADYQDGVARLKDLALRERLDVIEIDSHIAWAEGMLGAVGQEEPEADIEQATTPEINETAPCAGEEADMVATSADAPATRSKQLFTAPIQEPRIVADSEVIERRRRLGLV